MSKARGLFVLCRSSSSNGGFVRTQNSLWHKKVWQWRMKSSKIRTPVANSMNSNADTANQEDAIPTDEDIDAFNAGCLDDHDDVDAVKREGAAAGPSTEPCDSDAAKEKSEEEMRARAIAKCPTDHIVLRLQYLDDRVRYVHAPGNMPVMYFKRKFFSEEILNQNKNVRLIFQGRELANREQTSGTMSAPIPGDSVDPSLRRLCDYGVRNNSTIHCLVSDMPANRSSPAVSRDREPTTRLVGNTSSVDVDFGSYFMMPLFALLIGFTWIFRFIFRQYFSFLSTTALILLSGLFCGAAWSVSRGARPVRHVEPAAGDATARNARAAPPRAVG
ncbi:transmembrane and ubiquitin-like [Sparganum proliferum]